MKPLFFWLVLFPTICFAQANDLWKKAVNEYSSGNFKNAAELFEQAFQKTQKIGYLYNIGSCHKKLGDYKKAIKSFESYLAKRPNATDAIKEIAECYVGLGDCNKAIGYYQRLLKTDPKNSAQTQDKISKLQSNLIIESSPQGGATQVNGKLKGQTPLILDLPCGRHLVRVEKQGHKPQQKDVQLDVGKKERVYFVLVEQKGKIVFKGKKLKGAELRIDDNTIGSLPLEKPLELRAGKHSIRITQSGFFPWKSQAEVQADSTKEIQVTLVSILDKQPPKPSIPVPAVVGWTSLGVAVVSEVLAWVFFAQGNGQDPLYGHEGFDNNRGLTIGFHVGAGVTAALGVGLVTWHYLRKDKDSGEAKTALVPSTKRGISW